MINEPNHEKHYKELKFFILKISLFKLLEEGILNMLKSVQTRSEVLRWEHGAQSFMDDIDDYYSKISM